MLHRNLQQELDSRHEAGQLAEVMSLHHVHVHG